MTLLLLLLLALSLVCVVDANAPAQPREYILQLADGADPIAFAEETKSLQYLGPVGQLEGYYRFQVLGDKPATSLRLRHTLDTDARVLFAEQQVPRVFVRRTIQDPLYAQQWHLPLVEAYQAWVGLNATGAGVSIAIVDDGLQHTHPDIVARYSAAQSHDFNDGDADPTPNPDDSHGTSAAGVAAATCNNTVCGCGVAPRATLAGIRLIAGGVTDYDESVGLSYQTNANDIYSNSWGPSDDGQHFEGPHRLVLETFARYASVGRRGRGTIWVWAAGNGAHVGDNCGADGYVQSPYTIAIGALGSDGKRAFYSESCAALMAVAPSSGARGTPAITTTALQGQCTEKFGGTSSACPLAAGVIALMLQKNPQLTWRDVQVLIAKHSVVIDATASDWSRNSRGFRHSHQYGFGLLKAPELVQQASTWTSLPTQLGFSSGRITVSHTVAADGTPTCASHRFIRSGITFVEHVLVRVYARHPRRGQLRIRLKSPEGVTSVLLDARAPDEFPWVTGGLLFTSVRHFGESSGDGEWILCVEDAVPGDAWGPGTLDAFEMAVFGH